MGVPAEKGPWLRLVRPVETPDPAEEDERYADWDAVYLDNVRWLYRVIFSKVGNRPDAEDLTGEVFLTALPRLRLDASRPEVRAYLLATARSTLAAHWRRTLGREITGIGLDERAEELAEVPTERYDRHAERARVILGRLPERYRRILELRFLEGCSIREAAVEMGVSVANAKVLQHRALRRAAELDREV